VAEAETIVKKGERKSLLKFINERTLFKILVERRGVLLSITTKNRAFFFFVSSVLFGIRVAPTTDPLPGIVELSDYDIERIVKNWNTLANVKLSKKISKYHQIVYPSTQIDSLAKFKQT
jgi:hypothetical protein